MTILDKIMYELATKNILDRKALLAIGATNFSVNKQIASAIKQGYIRQSSFTLKNDRRKKTVDYFTLTPFGFLYVRHKMKQSVPWTNFISTFDHVRIGATSYKKKTIASRFIKTSTAALMADLIGARENTVYMANYSSEKNHHLSLDSDMPEPGISPCTLLTSTKAIDSPLSQTNDYFDFPNEEVYDDFFQEYIMCDEDDSFLDEWTTNEIDGLTPPATVPYTNDIFTSLVSPRDMPTNDKQSVSLSKIVPSAIYAYYDGISDGLSDITFIDALTIKKTIIENSLKKEMDPPDLRGGRYAGVLSSPFRFALVYMAMGIEPLTWRSNFRLREFSAYQGAKKLYASEKPVDNSANAILLVTDIDAFTYSYSPRPAKKKVHRIDDTVDLGEGFSHFWVVPISHEGTYELHELMTSDIDAKLDRIYRTLIEEDSFLPNEERLSGTFPLKDDLSDAYVAVCPHLDVRQIKNLEYTMRRFPKNKYIILCHNWQMPFLQRVLSCFAEIRSLDQPYSKVRSPDKRERTPIQMAVEKEAQRWSQQAPMLIKEP